MNTVLIAALFANTIIPTAELPPSAADPCMSFDRPGSQRKAVRHVRASDLVALADIGRSDPHESASPFGISPDGKQIAFLIRRANAKENLYCQRLVVTSMDGSGRTNELDRGGAFIRSDFVLRKFVSVMSGSAKVITPHWSPDGSQIAYLKQEGPVTQVWLVSSDGEAPAYRATSMPDNVDDFAWANDGTALVVATRPGIRRQAEEIAREARTGFLFDERFAPQNADRPIPVEPVETEYKTVELATGNIRESTTDETALLNSARFTKAPGNARGYVEGSAKIAVWREPIYPRRLISPTRLVMELADGQKLICDDPKCQWTRKIWWSRDGRKLYTLQKSGWGKSQTALLAWNVDAAGPRQVFASDDVLVGCEMQDSELICAREGVTQTRRLVAIDADTGRERVIYDPNPDFQNIALGKVQRFRFRNAYGVESWADLVLPPGHKPGEKHPLVVVQYFSQGFLRGGTADEFPIQLLAAKGFAVLSFARPDMEPKAENERDLRLEFRIDWIDRRNVQSSLEMAIERAIATGTVDADHMGISGFSDGTSTTQWALINSSLFKVATMGACCEDIYAYPLAAGPYFTEWTRDMGYRFFEPGTEDYWKPMSLYLNVDRINTPILVQTGDSEYEIGLDVAEAYRRRGKAFELYVLEGEPHFKYQPAHRLSIYERSTEWFQFWLMRVMNCDPAKAAQYARWKAMKGAPLAANLKCETVNSVMP